MVSRKNRFPGSLGPWLVGQLELPEGESRACALLVHCFTCGKDLKSLVRLARELAARGIANLRFDVTGIGESEGDFSATNFTSIVGDVAAAARFLASQGLGPQLLIGHSIGGAAVVAAAREIASAQLVATIAATADTNRFRETILALAPDLERDGEAAIVLGGRRFRITRALLEDLPQHRVEDALAALARPLIVFHSPVDDTVPFADGQLMFERARTPKSFVCLDGADHLMLGSERDTRFIAEVLAAWTERYVR